MTRWAPIAAWFSRPDRVGLDRCGICDAAAGAPCNPDEPSFCHVGRRWDIGLTHPGDRLDVDAGTYPPRTPQCAPTVEVNDWYDFQQPRSFGGFERIAMLYRGACLGCGWAGDAHDDENVAVEDAHDHALPDWRRLPTSGCFPYADGAAGRRRYALLIAGINEHRRALGFGAGYLLGAGAPLLAHGLRRVRHLRRPGRIAAARSTGGAAEPVRGRHVIAHPGARTCEPIVRSFIQPTLEEAS